jgi:tripartite-type tricarboxylate transporter receptor subunit TctC
MLGSAQPGKTQATIDRPVTIYVAGTAGGGIDLYARLVARHMGRHIPGKPTVTVQVMPGAGGIRAANYLAEQAPRDGTAITTFANGPILEPLIGARNPGYDMSSFTWIGAITKDIGLCISWGPTPFKTIDDVKTQQMIVAGTGAGSETDTWPIVLNDVLGTKFKLVTGYVGSQETILAIERGEAHGRCVFSQSALKIAKPDWLHDKKINVLVLTALEKSAEFPGVPAVVDLVTKLEDRQRAHDGRGRAEAGRAYLCDAAAGGRARQKASGSVDPNATRPRRRVKQRSPKTCAKHAIVARADSPNTAWVGARLAARIGLRVFLWLTRARSRQPHGSRVRRDEGQRRGTAARLRRVVSLARRGAVRRAGLPPARGRGPVPPHRHHLRGLR